MRNIAGKAICSTIILALAGLSLLPSCSHESGDGVGEGAVMSVTPLVSLTTPVHARIYTTPPNPSSITFDKDTVPVFQEDYPTVAFNALDPLSRPFTDETFIPLHGVTGRVVVQGRAGTAEAGVGSGIANILKPSITTTFGLNDFQMGATGSFHVEAAGCVRLSALSDDGVILGIKGVSTSMNTTPLKGYPVVFTSDVPMSPAVIFADVVFPGAGDFDFEIDYFECCGAPLELILSEGACDGSPSFQVPATLGLALPQTLPPIMTGSTQLFTVTAADARGVPAANGTAVTVTILPFPPFPPISVPQNVTCTVAGGMGQASCSYTRTTTGLVTLQARASIAPASGLSNLTTQLWQ